MNAHQHIYTTWEKTMKSASKFVESEVSITEIEMTAVKFHIVGVTPLVPHAVSAKAKMQLLFPPKKKNAAEKATSMKHEPFDEFRDAAYKFRDDDKQPTRLYMPGCSFHGAMKNAALDMPGAKKSQIGRLTSIVGEQIPVWGVPQIYSTIMRSSDMARTPDVRTLPILPHWATSFTVRFVGSLISTVSIANLLGSAGEIVGIGDGRPEKGKKSNGKWRVCAEDDPEYLDIVASGGIKAQDHALADPEYYDLETEELLSWFLTEKNNRHAKPAKELKVKVPAKPATNGKELNA